MTLALKKRPSYSDAEQVAQVLAGDTTAFTRIYTDHHPRVFALLTRILGPVPDRDDLLQESFLQLYHALPAFRGDSSLATFLYRIVSRIAVKAGKRKRREPLTFDSEILERCFGDNNAGKDAQDRQLLEQTFTLLLQIRVERRIAFVLNAVEGLSYQEVGRVLDIAPDAAKQRCLRARRDLKQLLEKRQSEYRAGDIQ